MYMYTYNMFLFIIFFTHCECIYALCTIYLYVSFDPYIYACVCPLKLHTLAVLAAGTGTVVKLLGN